VIPTVVVVVLVDDVGVDPDVVDEPVFSNRPCNVG
jgi:hypothetical protein